MAKRPWSRFVWKLLGDRIHCKKSFSTFPSPAGISLTKLSLGGNYDVIDKLFLPRESLVCDIPAGDGKIAILFLKCSMSLTHLKWWPAAWYCGRALYDLDPPEVMTCCLILWKSSVCILMISWLASWVQLSRYRTFRASEIRSKLYLRGKNSFIRQLTGGQYHWLQPETIFSNL